MTKSTLSRRKELRRGTGSWKKSRTPGITVRCSKNFAILKKGSQARKDEILNGRKDQIGKQEESFWEAQGQGISSLPRRDGRFTVSRKSQQAGLS